MKIGWAIATLRSGLLHFPAHPAPINTSSDSERGDSVLWVHQILFRSDINHCEARTVKTSTNYFSIVLINRFFDIRFGTPGLTKIREHSTGIPRFARSSSIIIGRNKIPHWQPFLSYSDQSVRRCSKNNHFIWERHMKSIADKCPI